MNLSLIRNSFTKDGVFGQLFDESGDLLAVTLEHAYEQSDGSYKPKIPEGSYKCVRGQHQLHSTPHPFETFEVTQVPGHDHILIHWGNYNKDSDGCILVGSNVFTATNGIAMVTSSRPTFEKIMDLQEGVNEFVLTVS